MLAALGGDLPRADHVLAADLDRRPGRGRSSTRARWPSPAACRRTPTGSPARPRRRRDRATGGVQVQARPPSIGPGKTRSPSGCAGPQTKQVGKACSAGIQAGEVLRGLARLLDRRRRRERDGGRRVAALGDDGVAVQEPDAARNRLLERQRDAQGRRQEEADLRARPDLGRDEPADIATVTGPGRTVETLRDGDRYGQTAGQGLEPQLPDPETGVLPITPPGNGSAMQYRTLSARTAPSVVLPQRYSQRYIAGRPSGDARSLRTTRVLLVMPDAGNGSVQLLEADPELARGLDPRRVREVSQRLFARAIDVPRGPWSPARALAGGTNPIGLLVLDGLLVREAIVGDHPCAELLGPGDLLRAWEDRDAEVLLPRTVEWSALSTRPPRGDRSGARRARRAVAGDLRLARRARRPPGRAAGRDASDRPPHARG